MLRIRSWAKWQGDALYDRLRKRSPAGRSRPMTLAYIAVATNLEDVSGNFARFSDQIGCGIDARGYLTMVLGYVGRMAATTGVITCSREQFGAVVLTDPTVQTKRAKGVAVYDALISSGIAEEVSPEEVREVSREASREASPPTSREVGGRRGEERRGDTPPPPSEGGECSPLATDGPSMRPRDRERFGRVLDYVIQCGTIPERDAATMIRHRLRSGDVTDHEIRELMNGKLSWVTADKLARHFNPKKGMAL